MAWIIAGMYEIQEQIGAGGGGIVYLGRHLRLDKQIVLKADKRTLNTDPQILRREVDMLKGLSQTYIPQVYDFVQENGVVYTVMDFIEGESLDHLLKRGQVPSQPEIIRWSCQLLEALDYLHGRPPYGFLHGDIKPANIMLRPNGDICLIDYNIALALGEEGAVTVGFSWGYASPEHYGVDYSSKKKQTLKTTIPQNAEPENGEKEKLSSSPDGLETVDISAMGQKENGSKDATIDIGSLSKGSPSKSSPSVSGQSSATAGSKGVMLDVRSDIYSLGATLYHLLSGRRPERNALEVQALGPDVCSPAVWKIIEKSMAPDPEMRYQTAGDMLRAFSQLHKTDPRVIRRKRHMTMTAAVLSVLFLGGGASTFVGMKRLERTQESLALSEYSSNHLAEGDIYGAVELAMEAIPKRNGIFEPPAVPQAQKALTDALGVYDLSDGFKSFDTLKLPSAPFAIAVSPKGTWFAAVYQYEVAVFDMETRTKQAVLPTEPSALSDVVFVDEACMVYAGEQGITAFDLNEGKILWTGETVTTLALSGDGTAVAGVNRDDDHAVIYRIWDGTKMGECSFEGQHMDVAANDIFANPGNRIFSFNETGDLLAVSFSEGGLWIFDLNDPEGNMILYDQSDYTGFEGGFCGKYFAFAANKGDKSQFGLIDTEAADYAGGLESQDPFYLKTEGDQVYLANGNLLVKLDTKTLEEMELAYTNDALITGFSLWDGYVLVTTNDNGFSFYDSGANLLSSELCGEPWDFAALRGGYGVLANRNGPTVRFLKQESHEEAQLLSYDARYAHDEARISGDGKTAMFFDYENFRIYDMEGNLLVQGEFPESRYIYDQQFRKEGEESCLEVIWYDGTVRNYSASDGSLISEEKKDPPSEDLYEEFYTDRYRIASSLHGAPIVYESESGREVKTLEEDAYLTYVTQAGEHIITEYVSAEGARYGLLLDGNLETVAVLPNLCDYADGNLIFDYETGNLRQCRLYSLQELMDLGEIYLQNQEKGEDE